MVLFVKKNETNANTRHVFFMHVVSRMSAALPRCGTCATSGIGSNPTGAAHVPL